MKRLDASRLRDAVLGVALLLGAAACTWHGIRADSGHTGHLYITGKTRHVGDDEIAAIAAPYLKKPLFDVDIGALHNALARRAWIADVQVSRHWPNGVTVHVREHRAVALWGREGVLGADGRVFVPDADSRPQDLVALDGPAAAGLAVFQQYRRMAGLLHGHHQRIARLVLDARGSWTATLDNGLELRLGRDHLGERMQRYVDYALRRGQARRALEQAGYVDLRYSDGFAVGGKRAAREPHREKGNEQAA